MRVERLTIFLISDHRLHLYLAQRLQRTIQQHRAINRLTTASVLLIETDPMRVAQRWIEEQPELLIPMVTVGGIDKLTIVADGTATCG